MKPTGLGLAALICTMTLSLALAGTAAAETAEWMSDGRTFSELSISEKKVATSSSGPLSIKVPTFKLEIVCTEVTNEGGLLKGGYTQLTTTLKACKASGVPACSLKEPTVLKTKSELIHAGGVYYDKVAAKEKNIGTLSFNGKECPLPEEAALTGEFASAISLEESEKQPMNFSEALTKAVNGALKKEGKSELSLFFGAGKQTMYLGGEFLLVPPPPPELLRQAPITKLCTWLTDVCPLGEFHGAGTPVEILHLNESIFTYGALLECEEAELEGGTEAASGSPLLVLVLSFRFGLECGNETGCKVERLGNTIPILSISTLGNNSGNGLLAIPNLVLHIECPGQTCVYSVANVLFRITGASVAVMRGGPFRLAVAGGSDVTCQANGWWSGPGASGVLEYAIGQPTPLYVTG